MTGQTSSKNTLQSLIASQALHTDTNDTITPNGEPLEWYFDFRPLLLQPRFIAHLQNLFWQKFDNSQPYSIGGLESAAIPMVSAFIQANERAQGFYIRKSRKKKMTLRDIEGNEPSDRIILVDDLINSGSSFEKQINILEKNGHRVSDVFVIVQFRETEAYTFLTEKNITLHSLFTLSDFNIALSDNDRIKSSPHATWYFGPKHPHLFVVEPVAQPLSEVSRIYTVSDNGSVWALQPDSGTVMWQRKLPLTKKPKYSTFTSPVSHENHLILGTSEGTLYCLAKDSGEIVWSHSISSRICSLEIPAESSLAIMVTEERPRESRIIGFDLASQEIIWTYEHTQQVTAPLRAVNDHIILTDRAGNILVFDPTTGSVTTSCKLPALCEQNLSFDPASQKYYAALQDGQLAVLSTDFVIEKTVSTAPHLYAAPLCTPEHIILTGLNHQVHCLDKNSLEIQWQFDTNGRIFSSPRLVGNAIYVGTNTGKLHRLELADGTETHQYRLTERITNPIFSDSNALFIPTQANEIYRFERPDK